MREDVAQAPERMTLYQRLAYRKMLKLAGKRRDQPLTPEDWGAYYELGMKAGSRLTGRLLRALPANPRCRFCGAPFAGFGGRVVKPLGYKPSRKNPRLCAVCVELAPPGGMTMEIGVLFADIRGFTTLSETTDPQTLSELLRRFYAYAEGILFEHAIIDKLIGDEVMALYIPMLAQTDDEPAVQMVQDARDLLAAVGDSLEVGVGLDFGEAFVGNIGDRSLYDFTAVGDVVNTASRLQGQASGGEVVLSGRLAARLDAPPGEPVELALKGKAEPFAAYRIRPDAAERAAQEPSTA